MAGKELYPMTIFLVAVIAGVSYLLTRLFFAIWAAPLAMAAFFAVVLGLEWLDGAPWCEVLSSFQGIMALFGLVLGVGLFFGGAQIAGIIVFSLFLIVSALFNPMQRDGELTAFNSTHQSEMLVYDTQQGWLVEKLPLRHPWDRLIQVSDTQWNKADPDEYNNDYSRPDKHPDKLVETAPGKWEFVKREEAYSEVVLDEYLHSPITRWYAKVRSNVPVTDITRPTINPYYVAVHAKAAEVAVHKAAEPTTPSFFQKPIFIISLSMLGLGSILWVFTRLTGIKI